MWFEKVYLHLAPVRLSAPPQAVDDDSGAFEVEVLRDDVSTFLVLAPEDEYLGAKVQGFIPRDDGGLSALEMHGQVSFVAVCSSNRRACWNGLTFRPWSRI